ncbi:alpha-amylase family glycosyl hydrolase [Glaciecola sp. SC05]|uniref:alpha-amylase family glycosyl hydrolase n=1 Tax=Glaciecola sp. SC05 TaxID=1987355 RepID=UPI0035275C60
MKTINKPFSFATISLAMLVALLISACSPANKTEPLEQTQTAPDANNNGLVAEQGLPFLSRNIQDEIFYFVMPDRFHNAKPENDNGDPARPISYGGLDVSSKWAFHGGDIAGLEAKLDYIQNLGVTSIWMTPILRNRAVQPDGFAHHGYWVVDFTEIDPHFGTNDDLKSLIDAAHKRDIKIFFDIITNHTADVIKYKECHDANGKFLNSEQKGCPFIASDELAQGKQYTPFILPGEENVKMPAWLNDPSLYNNQGDSFWQGESVIKGDFAGLDDIDTSKPEVLEGMTEIFKNLITEFKPDGFRIDTVKHVDLEFWQSFGPDIIAHAKSIGIPEFFIFGEVYDGNPAGLSKYTNAGKLPSVLDFGFAFNVKDVVFTDKNVSQLANLIDNDDYYRDADSGPNELLNFLGNHDMGRVGQFIAQGLPDISEQEKLARSKLAHAFMYLSRGVPVVYYGDEQGFTSDSGDVDARENMDPSKVDSYNDNNLIGTSKTTADDNFDTSHPLYQAIAKLAKLRQAHKALRRGEQINRFIDEQKRVYAFSRIVPNTLHDYMAVFNFSNESQKVSMPKSAVPYSVLSESASSMTQTQEQFMFELAPLSYILVRSQDPLPASNIQEINMLAKYEENERIFLPIELSFAPSQEFNIAHIKFYAIKNSGSGDVSETLIAYDTSFPYRAVLMPQQLENVQQIKVLATNSAGQVMTRTFEL